MNRDAAIEAGARDLYERRWMHQKWGALQDDRRPYYRAEAAAVIDAALPHLAPRPERVVKAEALREAADAWQVKGWADDLSSVGPTRVQAIIGMSQRALTFLRTRADRIERGEP